MSPKTSTKPSGGPSGGRARELVTPSRLLLLVIAILALVFVFENTRQVKVRLLLPEVTVPLWIALAVMLVIGWLVGRFVTFRRK
ncbi:DUF1049 domain-containing protein [Streptomyces varsoviensis]|uniref:Lipopolysaccharide assembly protein A domain-containing protein n=1 Tax=Streptomyces varsoviensis TaxID=67373 RepID=A0ABR5J1Z2_9ACTN|nr:DUF1049 domain-containing protein [Streptomyces varsoviensis]KOG87352.1 hypothetical protein ADK38_25915 [Streptomyces varsoviensis]